MTTISMTTTMAPMRGRLQALMPGWRRGFARLADAVGAASADDATAYQVPVAHGTMRCFTRPRGLCLSCVRGHLWITVDGETADHVLASGESFEPSSARRVIVYGLDDAVLRVQPLQMLHARPPLVVQADPT